MDVFSTITSTVFSEIVVILKDENIAHLHQEVTMFETLRGMNKEKPFNLVFLLEVPDSRQWEAQDELEGVLDFVAARGHFDFLNSPPTIRSTRFRQVRWDMTSPELQ